MIIIHAKRNVVAGRKRKKKTIAISLLIFFTILIVIASSWSIHIRQLRAEMESRLADMIENIELDGFSTALNKAMDTRDLAERLRDDSTLGEIEAYIRLIEAILFADDLFITGSYEIARNAYLLALKYSDEIDRLGSGYINDKIASAEGYIYFLHLIDLADNLMEQTLYEAALSLYEEAELAASVLSFTKGKELAAKGKENAKEQIILLKRAQADSLYSMGDQSLSGGFYAKSIAYYRDALEIYQELDDLQVIAVINEKIGIAERRLAFQEEQEKENSSQDTSKDSSQDTTNDASNDARPPEDGSLSNYDHNRSVKFDMVSLIDDQNRRPANQIRMGSSGGRNEGWYNGCGWVATYNALLLLGDPRHPADIINYFEAIGGTVLGGVFGTYPQAIERLFSDLGYGVEHVLFPQTSINIDDAIKAARVGILAYIHSTAAHYIAIEYREADGKYIVYNDGFAHARSKYLGFENDSDVGAAIDSVAALIQNTSNILFSFSLITISS